MRLNESARRKFLKNAGAGFAGGALIGLSREALGADEGQASGKLFYDVAAFGAKGDGKTIDSPAINRAIDEAAGSGGGTVYFRAGNYLCYSIHLKSRVALYLEHGATILAADPSSDLAHGYDLAEPKQDWEEYQDYGHNHWHNSLIWGEGLNDISICGPGLIWGKGLSRGWGAGPEAEAAGCGEQSDFAQELPERTAARFFDPAWRAFRDSRDRRGQSHDRQSENRHQPRRHGY